MTVPQAAQMIMQPSSMDEMVEAEADDKFKDAPRLPGLFAYAKGLKDGQEKAVGVTVLAGVGGGMGGATGVPMGIGLKLLHEGKISKKGVFAPEMVIDPDDFFDELGPLCTGCLFVVRVDGFDLRRKSFSVEGAPAPIGEFRRCAEIRL